MRNFYKLLLIVFVPAFSFAQSNFKPGYVVTQKGDTVRGFINYKEWNTSPDAIEFKTQTNSPRSQKFTPSDITFFSVDDLESYQKFSGKISTNYIDPDRITTGKDTSFKMTSVFLKIMAKGKYVTLLSYIDDIRPHFYIEEASDPAPVELVYSLYRNDDAGSKTVSDNTYMRQLYFLAQKYNVLTDDLQNDIQHMNYSAGNMLDVVHKINGPEQRQKVNQDNSCRRF
jgi:hypothetical protein